METSPANEKYAGIIRLPGFKKPVDSQLIHRLAGDGNYTRLFLSTQTAPVLVSQTLNYFTGILPGFLRVHKSGLINPNSVRAVLEEKSRQLQLVLVDVTIIDVSRRRVSEVKASLFHYQYDRTKRIWLIIR